MISQAAPHRLIGMKVCSGAYRHRYQPLRPSVMVNVNIADPTAAGMPTSQKHEHYLLGSPAKITSSFKYLYLRVEGQMDEGKT